MHKTQKKLEEVQFFNAIQSYTNVGYTKTRELTVLTLLDKVIKLKHKYEHERGEKNLIFTIPWPIQLMCECEQRQVQIESDMRNSRNRDVNQIGSKEHQQQ